MWSVRSLVLLVVVFISLASLLTVSTQGARWFGNDAPKSLNEGNHDPHMLVESLTFSLDVNAESAARRTDTWVEVVSWVPRAFVVHNFLTPSECDHLIKEAEDKLERSTVVGDAKSRESKVDKVRTSSGTFLARLLDNKITEIEEKVAMLTGIPLVNGEDMQVLRYEHNQKYSAHNDYFPSEYLSHTDGMQRTATILLYLTDVEKGGETHFPFGHPLKDYIHRHGGDASKFSDCASSTSGPFSAAVIPKRGDALLFYSMDPSNQLVDPKSNHEGCPVLEGVKWSSTIWMHQGPFREVKETPKKACQDENESCASWAASGECEKNPLYMHNQCAVSCNICQDCAPNDALCERKNNLKRRNRGMR